MAWPPITHQDAVDEVDTLRNGKGWATTLGGRYVLSEPLRSSPLLWVAGRWYNPQIVGASTTVTPTAAELRLLALYLPAGRTVNRIGCNVTTAGSAGHVARLGVYNADPATGLPTTVLVDAGTVAVDTTGVKEVAISATMNGLHWLCLTTQSGAFTALGSSTVPYLAGGTLAHGTPANGLAYGSVAATSALPDRTGVAPTFVGAAVVPTVGVRAL